MALVVRGGQERDATRLSSLGKYPSGIGARKLLSLDTRGKLFENRSKL
jgi:hypothetical protein